MSSLEFLEVEITLKSPAILASRVTGSGYLKPLNYIPGSTLRGALLTALYYQGYVNQDHLKEEWKEPKLLVSPAHPLTETGQRTLPATPADFECKVCGRRISMLHELVSALKGKRYDSIDLSAECPQHGPMKPLYALHVYRGVRGLETYSHNVFYAASTAINKAMCTAMKGMLFNYEAIAANTRFWARLAVPVTIADKMPRAFEVYIGRGRSRGFGRAEVKIVRESTAPGAELSNVFIALSSLLPLRELKWGPCALTINVAYGRPFRVLSGWDMVADLHRPIVTAIRQGAVLKANVVCSDNKSLREFIALLAHGGVPLKHGYTWITGFNVVVPVEEYLDLRGDGRV